MPVKYTESSDKVLRTNVHITLRFTKAQYAKLYNRAFDKRITLNRLATKISLQAVNDELAKEGQR